MKHIKVLYKSLIFLFLAAMAVLPANAALQAASPLRDPLNGFPTFYTDANGLALAPCLDQNGFCILPVAPVTLLLPPAPGTNTVVFTPGSPIVFPPAVPAAFPPGNFPQEFAYWSATAKMPVGNLSHTAVMAIGLFASFTPIGGLNKAFIDPVPQNGNQMTFLRVDMNIPLVAGVLAPNSTYTVTEPFGIHTFTTDLAGKPVAPKGQILRLLDGGAFQLDFVSVIPALNTNIGPFLTPIAMPAGGIIDPATGNHYIGNPLALTPITPGPSGAIFSIAGPNAAPGGAGALASTNQWNVAGKIADTIPPIIVSTGAAPAVFEAIVGTTILSVNATDNTGVHQVLVDLSAMGGSPVGNMSLATGNQTNGMWTMTANSTTGGNFILPVKAIDGSGNFNTSTISVTVVSRPILTVNPTIVTVGNATRVDVFVTQGGALVPNATVTLSGAATGSNVTDATGNAIFIVNATAAGTINITATNPAFLSPGTATITAAPPFIKGCVVDAICTATAGKPTIVDALFIAQQTVGLRTFTTTQMAAGDVNADGAVNIVDALFIAQFTVGLRPVL